MSSLTNMKLSYHTYYTYRIVRQLCMDIVAGLQPCLAMIIIVGIVFIKPPLSSINHLIRSCDCSALEEFFDSYIVPDWIDDSDVTLDCSEENSEGRRKH